MRIDSDIGSKSDRNITDTGKGQGSGTVNVTVMRKCPLQSKRFMFVCFLFLLLNKVSYI